MNRERLLELAEHIRSLDPGEYDQSVFTHCNTPACLAGHTVAKWGDFAMAKKYSFSYPGEGMSGNLFFKEAKRLLDLTQYQANMLFTGAPFTLKRGDGQYHRPTQEEAASVLERMARSWAPDLLVLPRWVMQ